MKLKYLSKKYIELVNKAKLLIEKEKVKNPVSLLL